jgi:hypothetical protein
MIQSMLPVNPFRHTAPVGIDDLIDRDGETDLLLATAREGNHARVVAPRRYGKTSLLRRVIGEAEADGWTGVYVDFFGVLTLGDVADRVERAYLASLTGTLARWFDGVRRTLRPTVSASAGGVRATAHLEPVRAALAERLDLPLRLYERTGRRALVVFDEFQEVLTADAKADAVLRASLQHHGDAASYVFAGSHVGMMNALFGDRRRAFYAQARPVVLPPLAARDCADFVAARFDRTGKDVGRALGPLLDLTAGHPQRTILMAHAVWELTPVGGTADEATLTAARDRVLDDLSDEFRTLWLSLPSGQRRVLAAVAAGEAPYGAASVGGSRGGAVHAALQALVGRGDVVSTPGARPRYRLVDPLLGAWVGEARRVG